MKTQKGGDTMAFEYDESGKIKKVVKDSEIWSLDEGNVVNNRISTDIRRNGKRHARITIRPEEESFYGGKRKLEYQDYGISLQKKAPGPEPRSWEKACS